jgi:quercetin dioxygenase-like cupin family protein
LDWVAAQRIPVHSGFGIDLRRAAVETWGWLGGGARAAFVHLDGRGDFVSALVVELPPGCRSDPERHLYEEVVYVVEGHGGTSIEGGDGSRHDFEWGPGSLFALPLNCRHRHFNASGKERVRFASVTNLPFILNAFHNLAFVFDNPFAFLERLGPNRAFAGDGQFIPTRPGRHMWETNFVPDLPGFELQAWEQRGAGSSNIKFVLADGTMHAHMSQLAVGTYKKAHRHGPDFHILPVTGYGYSLFWYEGDGDFRRVDWEPGWVYAPPDMMFHQHFNTAPKPSRYLAVAFGSIRYPFSADKRALFGGRVDRSTARGGAQIEYEDEDPRIRRLFEAALAGRGLKPDKRMEDAWRATARPAT